jgi:membrane protein implicated in regulation of membrane protease activity
VLENFHCIIKEECFLFALQVLNLADPGFWWLLIVLLIIALIAIVVIGFLFAFPIAALAAIVVFFLTGSLLWSGVTFLVVALISIAVGDLLHMTRRHHHEDEHED